MPEVLAGMAVALLLCCTVLGVFFALGRGPRRTRHGTSRINVGSMPPRSPKSVNAYWADERPGQDRRVQWNTSGAEEPADGVQYRAQPGASQGRTHWNPFEPQAHRVRAARRRPRPQHHADRKDYYTLLGVEHDASDRQIERAFRMRAAEVHPDRFFNDPVLRREAEVRLKELNAAMQVLRDPVRRAKYDASR